MWGMQPLLIALHTGVHDEEALRPKLRARCGRSCDLSLERPASVAVKETGMSVFECESSKTETVWARDVTQQRSISRQRQHTTRVLRVSIEAVSCLLQLVLLQLVLLQRFNRRGA